MSGSSRQLTLKKGAPWDQVWDLLCMQLASYLEMGPLMWMMPLHLQANQKSDYDYDDLLTWHSTGMEPIASILSWASEKQNLSRK